MKLIKDLGIIYPTTKSKQRYNYGIYECPICLSGFRVRTTIANKDGVSSCRKCSAKIRKHKHGFACGNSKRHPLYSVHNRILQRCYNPNDKSYKTYGAVGITICEEWKNNPALFIEWCIDNGWEKGLVVDKDILCEQKNIYPKTYSPETCMFITRSENTRESATRYQNKLREENERKQAQ